MKKFRGYLKLEDMKKDNFRIKTIADISDDKYGSVPCNLGDNTMEDPVYGVDKITGKRTDLMLKDRSM